MIEHDYNIEKIKNRQRAYIAGLLTKAFRRMSPVSPYLRAVQAGRAVVSVYPQSKSLIVDFHEVLGPALLSPDRMADPHAEYYSANKYLDFEFCTSGYELVHQGALRRKVATITIPLNWWQRLWVS